MSSEDSWTWRDTATTVLVLSATSLMGLYLWATFFTAAGSPLAFWKVALGEIGLLSAAGYFRHHSGGQFIENLMKAITDRVEK